MRYHYRKVKYWKVVKDNLDINTALQIFAAQAIEGHLYDYLAIRYKYRIFEPDSITVTEIKNKERFSIDEATSDNWEAIVPDDGMEELLEKARDIVKDSHFLRMSDDKINNLDMNALWNEIDNVLIMLDEKSKYRLIKHVVENKLYKKA